MKASNGLKLSSCVFVLLVGLLVKHTTSQVVLGFSEEDYAVVEGRNAMVTVTKNNQNQFPISLSIVPLTYSQYQGIVPTEIQGIIDTVTPTPAQFVQGGRTDFSDLSIPITFPPSLSSDSVTVAVGASDDFINEASEGFIIMLRVDQIDPADGTPTFVREGVALMRITDDDAVSISFSAPSYDVSEGAGLLSNLVFIVKDLESEQNLTVIISRQITSAGASFATPDVDFVDIVTMSFTFLPADTMLPIAIEILEDTEPEADEMFTLIISIPPGQPRVTPGTPPQAAVVIADDDGTTLEVGFLQTTYTVMEGEDAVITFGLLTDPTLLTADDFAVIDIEVVADTATSSVDYDSSAVADGFYFIAVGGATSSFTIPTTLDTDVEGSESFVVRLAFSQEVGNVAGDFVVRESNRQATVIIQEPGGNEPTVLELTPSPSLAGIEGDIITFTCGPPENDPITLLVNGLADTTVAFDDATGNRTYSLGPLDRNMEGNTYQCTSGTRMSEITTLSVYYPPVFTVGAFFEGNEGDALRINLSLDGNPLPLDSFSWTYDGQPLSAETGRLVFGAEFIEFTPLQRTDRGRYMITGSNLAGNGSAFFDLEVYYVPSYIADPVYTVIEGQPGQIQLSLDARPLPGPSEFSWSRDGVPISSSGQVTLTSDSIDWSSVNRSDGGAYMVVATNRAGSGTASFQVVVIYPPVYTVDSRIAVVEGDLVRINLTLDANPDPTSFTWTRDGVPFTPPPGGSVGVNFIDFGGPINRTAGGSYTVQSTNDAGTGNATFQLEILYPADSRIVVVEGNPILINLDANPNPTSFFWTRNGVPFTPPPGGSVGPNFIDFGGPISRSAEGTYTVQSTSDAGTVNSTFQLEVIHPPVYTVDSRIAVVEGDLVRINLTLDANPDPTSFTWTRDGVPFTPPPGGSVGVNFIDFGGPINRTAGGSYTVQSTNDAGTGNATFQLEILYPADSRIVVVEGNPILINLDANPNPTSFFWTRNGVPFTPPPGGSVGPNFIDFGGPIDRTAGGTYTVQSTSDAGTVNSTFQLEVIHPPVYTVDSRIAVVEGDLVRINLTLDANPDPTSFTWTRDGVPFTPPPGGSVGVNFIDFGGPINRTAGGSYTVQSTNDAGTGNATFQLNIYYPPVITVNNTFTVLEGEVFDLTLLVDSLPVLTDDNVTWFFNNQVIPGMMGISFGADFIRIDMVTRLDGGTYRVEGTNVAGTGEASFSLQVVVPMPTTVIPTVTSTPTLVSTSVPVLSTTSMPNPTTSVPRPTVTPTPEPPVTTVTEPPQTTGGMGGDPHFNILLPNHQQLCFSVQGEHGYSFNLISNKLIHMNARFIPDPKREEVTWIGSLGIVVTSSTKMNATRIRFEAEDKMIYIGEKLSLHVKKIDRLTFTNGKLTISEALRDKKEKRFRVHVELVDIGLSFRVDFVKGHLDMTWNKVGKQPANSHGIIGQFFRPHIEIDEARRLLLLPTLEPVAVMRKPVWHFMERESPDEKLCWVAMNQGYQGKGLLQGHYLDYLVDDVLTPDFKFKLRKHKKSIEKLL